MKIKNIILLVMLVIVTVPSIMASTIDERTLGDDNAPVTIEMFADFEDIYCARWHTQTFPELEDGYIEEGKVKFVVKYFPLSFHSRAKSTSIAAECAAEQNEFYDYINLLYSNQQDLQDNDLIAYAEEVSLDVDQFKLCYESSSTESEVEDDIDEGTDRLVTGTPTFFINGKSLVGSQLFEAFDSAIKEALGNDVNKPKDLQREPMKGDKFAPVKIVGYMGFNDPYSHKSWNTINDLFDEFGDDIQFEFRNFPFSFQDPNDVVAQAGECVLNQAGKETFFKYVDLLMANGNNDETTSIREANSLGVDIKDCLNSKEFLPEVLDDIEEGKYNQVSGTPTFFINDKKLTGSQSYANFVEVISEQLGRDNHVKEFCGDNICQSDEDKLTCPHDCEVVEKGVCSEGQIKKYTCADKSQVNWCECIGDGWVCVSNPQYLCSQTVEETCSQGCTVEGKCIPYGQRFLNKNEKRYCSLSGDLTIQKVDGAQCQNNYECISNQCNSGVCVDLSKELEETKGLMKRILEFFSKWFK